MFSLEQADSSHLLDRSVLEEKWITGRRKKFLKETQWGRSHEKGAD